MCLPYSKLRLQVNCHVAYLSNHNSLFRLRRTPVPVDTALLASGHKYGNRNCLYEKYLCIGLATTIDAILHIDHRLLVEVWSNFMFFLGKTGNPIEDLFSIVGGSPPFGKKTKNYFPFFMFFVEGFPNSVGV